MPAQRSPLLIIIFTMLIQLSLAGCATLLNRPPYSAIPRRPNDAPSGKEFVASLQGKGGYQREEAILKQLRRGNLPSFLRDLVPITVQSELPNRGPTEATLWVMPDYLAIGSDYDSIRFPMNPITAQRIADHFGFVLPTTKIVDLIYEQASIKLVYQPFPPDRNMVRTNRFVEHHELIQSQLREAHPGELVAGHKKDVVLTNRIVRRRYRVAIYGWYDVKGKTIQPLSTIHGNHYADYSHGIRLVAGMMLVDGEPLPVAEVLQDPQLAPLISQEGPLKFTRYPTEGALKRKKW